MSLKAAIRSLPLGATEQPLVVELVGTIDARDFIANLRDAYASAGPRCGLLTTPLWKSSTANPARTVGGKGAKKGSPDKGSASEGDAQTVHRIVLSRPVHIKSASSISRAHVRLGTASLVVCAPGVTLERVDISGVGRPGMGAPLEARALVGGMRHTAYY